MIDHLKKARLEVIHALQTVNFREPLCEVLEEISTEIEELVIELSAKK